MNILAISSISIAKKILLTENKSHGKFGHLLYVFLKQQVSLVNIRSNEGIGL